jgi:hypothetical protein
MLRMTPYGTPALFNLPEPNSCAEVEFGFFRDANLAGIDTSSIDLLDRYVHGITIDKPIESETSDMIIKARAEAIRKGCYFRAAGPGANHDAPKFVKRQCALLDRCSLLRRLNDCSNRCRPPLLSAL